MLNNIGQNCLFEDSAIGKPSMFIFNDTLSGINLTLSNFDRKHSLKPRCQYKPPQANVLIEIDLALWKIVRGSIGKSNGSVWLHISSKSRT